MMRSAVNVLSQISAATLIERWSGRKQTGQSTGKQTKTHK
jgi:Na+/H+-dicarboxylate symporter